MFPGITESVLGKRHRTATPTQIEPDLQEEAPPRSILGPAKKKPKLQGSNAGSSRRSSRKVSGGDRRTPNDDMNAFTVFRASAEPEDFNDPPPPTNRLPEFFEPDSPPLTSTLPRPVSKVTRTSANAAENQPQSFGFGFLPISSTPRDPMYMPSFPYPEAPQSPSPTGPSSRYTTVQPEERTDIFKNFGLPSPIKSSRHYGALTQDRGVNPAAITQTSSSKPRETSVHMGPVPSTSTTVDPPLTKATMYGTELDGDTRFGDFGLDHMATGYWANKRY
jgi:hypothetical protein